MLSSPYLVEHKVEAQQWAESLQEVEEVIDIWYEVQTKWLYLLKIFDDPDFFRRLEPQVNKFNMLHRKFTVSTRCLSFGNLRVNCLLSALAIK